MIFVTGANGFIGKYVVAELLSQKQQVLCLVRDVNIYRRIGNEELIEGNLGTLGYLESQLREAQVDTCIHLAWEGIPDYSYETSYRNLDYGLQLLNTCKNIGVQNLVITGSCWEYENPTGCITTGQQVSCENAFKAAKNSLRMMAHAFCKENKIHFNWMRLFYVYGQGQREGSLIPYIIRSFKQGVKPQLNGAYNENDFVYVQDVAKAIVKVSLKHDYPEILNVGSGKAIRVLDIVKEVATQYHIQISESDYIYHKGISFYANPEEMQKEFNWNSKITLSEGIQKILQ